MTHGRSELDIEEVLDDVVEACAREGDEECVERMRERRDAVEARGARVRARRGGRGDGAVRGGGGRGGGEDEL